MKFYRLQHGFTMLPLILFLFVIVGLISAGYMMLGSKVQLGKTVETKAGLEKVVDAIISWSVANGHLPTATELQNQNILPSSNDSWGRPVVYGYDSNLTTAAGGGICGRTSVTYNGIAFVVISGGEDFILSSTPSTSQAFTTTPVTSPADLSKTVTLEELKNRAGCYGSTQGRLKILNNILPSTAACPPYTYNTSLFATGGVGTYSWSVESSPGWSISNSGSLSTSLPPSQATVTAVVTDSHGEKQSRLFSLKLHPSCTGTSSPTPDAAWGMNEGAGNTIGAASTLGTIAGTANWVARGGGYALFLNGTNNYIYFNDINHYNIGTGNVTLSAWVNFSGRPTQSWCDPVSKVDMAIGAIAGKGFLYPSIGYGMYVTQTRQCTSCTAGCGVWSNYKVAFQLRNPANSDIHSVYSDDVIAGGSWAHVVAVLDRSSSPATDQIRLYVNGVKQTDHSNDQQYAAPTTLDFNNLLKFTIGTRHAGGASYGFPYWGYIDDVQFYKTALTDGQVNSLYTTGLNP